jgi:hypothetical protein
MSQNRFFECTNTAVQGDVMTAFWANLDAESTGQASQEALLASVATARRALHAQVRFELKAGVSSDDIPEFMTTLLCLIALTISVLFPKYADMQSGLIESNIVSHADAHPIYSRFCSSRWRRASTMHWGRNLRYG